MSQVIKHVTDDILSFRVSFVCCQQSLKGKKSRKEPANKERGLPGTEGKRKKQAERGEEKGQ